MHHGMLTIYKEAGYTSSDAVARLRGILHMRKIGHTGTLDPDAEGVLPMCLGNATRICELIADKEKEYVAVMRLGVRTDTQDMSGKVLFKMEEDEILSCLCGGSPDAGEAADFSCSPEEAVDSGNRYYRTEEGEDSGDPSYSSCEQKAENGAGRIPEAPQERIAYAAHRIHAQAGRFVGEIEQVPPMYSAIKINGKRLYDLARKGRTVERKPRRVTIFALEIEKIELPLVTMRVRCSRGTYIRTLCEDIGNALGTGAAMESLLRTLVGQFTLEEARTLDEIERIAKTEPAEVLEALIRPVDSFFADLPAAACSEEALRLLKNGNALEKKDLRFLAPREDPCRAQSAAGQSGQSGQSLRGQSLREEGLIRVYDNAGSFYGLYKRAKGQRRYTAFKMFLPEKQEK